MSKFQCASHMSVPVSGFLKQSNTGNNRLGHKTRFPQKSSSSRNGKQDLNLFFCFFSSKCFLQSVAWVENPHARAFDSGNKDTLLQHNLWSAANVLRNTRGHLNNANILLKKKNPDSLLHTKNNDWQQFNRVAAIWARKVWRVQLKSDPERDKN